MSKLYLFLTAFTLLFLISCGAKKATGDVIIQHLPADASNVVILNMDNLIAKSAYQERKAQPEFKKFLKEAFSEMGALSIIAQDPEAAGIEMKGKHYAYAKVKGLLMPRRLGIVASPLADKSKLAKVLGGISGLELTKEKGVYLGRMGDFIIGYNDNFVALGHGDLDIMNGMGEVQAFLTSPKKEEKRLFATENTFAEFAKANQKDIAVWVSFDPVIRDFFADKKASARPKAMLSLATGAEPEDLEGTRVYLTTNFENGQTIWDMNVELNDFLKNELKSPWQKAEAFEFNKNLPDGQLGFLTSMNIDLSKVDAIVKKRNATKLINVFLKSYGVSYNDLIQGLGGGIVTAVYLTDDLGFDPIVGIQIKDPMIVDRFNTIMEKKAGMKINMDGVLINYESEELNLPLQATIKDNIFWIAAGDHQTTLLQIADGGFADADQIKLKNADKLQESLFSMHLDRTKSIGGGMETMGLGLAYAGMHPEAIEDMASVNQIEQVVQYMDGTHFITNLYLKNKTKNSLGVLLDMVIELQPLMDEDLFMGEDEVNLTF